MRWEQGRVIVDSLIERGDLERVPPNSDHADELLAQAHGHLGSAGSVVMTDPIGAYQLLYDAARKALCATLENQGLRATSRGGHIAVFEAVSAQLDPPMGRMLRPFDRMRRRRNEAEYPRQDSPRFVGEDVLKEIPKVRDIIDLATRVLTEMSPY